METTPEITQQALTLSDQAHALTIQTEDDLSRAGILLHRLKAMRQRISATFLPIIQKAHEAHKEALKQQQHLDRPMAEAEVKVKRAIAGYLEMQDAARRQAQAEATAAAAKVDEEHRLTQAAALEAAGQHQAADQVLNGPALPAPVIPAVPKPEGIFTREAWQAEVVDVQALIRAVADGNVPVYAIVPDMVFLNQQARALKGLMAYPGVTVRPKTVVVAGAGP